MNSELESAIRKRALLQQNVNNTSSEATRLQTIIGNFDREELSVKDKPDVVKALRLKSQPFRNRLATIQPDIDKAKAAIATLDIQIKAMQDVQP